MNHPLRGEVWIVNLDPVVGHEQAGQRPALIISVDAFNELKGDDIFVVPISSKYRAVRSRVGVKPPEGGLAQDSFILCEKMRSISQQRLKKRLGRVSDDTLIKVGEILSLILGIHSSD